MPIAKFSKGHNFVKNVGGITIFVLYTLLDTCNALYLY